MLRGTIYSGAFLVFMVILGLMSSPWAVLCLPAAMLIGFAFAGLGMAATTFMRSFVDFDYVNLALLPLFLFSGTFFPLSQYPPRAPGDRAVHAAVPGRRARAGARVRRRRAGPCSSTSLYLGVLGLAGLRIAGHRLAHLLQP